MWEHSCKYNFNLKIYFLLFLATKSKVTIGIAGPDIKEDAHPGNWNNTVGYHSDTGKCFTSHKEISNTNGEKFGIGMLYYIIILVFSILS